MAQSYRAPEAGELRRSTRGYAFLTVASLKGLLQRGEPEVPSGRAEVAIVGAGYVGLPLAREFADAGRTVLLVEALKARVASLNRGESHIEDVPSEVLRPLVESGRVSTTGDYERLREVDAILIALPTPLSAQREPDLSIVLGAAAGIAPRLRRGQLVVLESTTYPGTTRERLLPILETSGLRAGVYGARGLALPQRA